MDGQPIASFRRLVGGDVVDVLSSSADQREDSRRGSAAAMFSDVGSRLVSGLFISGQLGFVASACDEMRPVILSGLRFLV